MRSDPEVKAYLMGGIRTSIEQDIIQSTGFLTRYLDQPVEVAIVAGSGLGESLSSIITIKEEIAYHDIPRFPLSGVVGHKGTLVIGTIEGHNVVLFNGRKHIYEGESLVQVVYPSFIVSALGIPRLILTNAAGGLNPEFRVGDLMLIVEGINVLFRPFVFTEFPDSRKYHRLDASRIFSTAWRKHVLKIVEETGFLLRTGVYIATTGPSYETAAEVGYLRYMGGDAIGMSTVPEATVAAAHGIEVLGISFITNLLAEIPLKKTTHEEVIESSKEAGPRLASLIQTIIKHV